MSYIFKEYFRRFFKVSLKEINRIAKCFEFFQEYLLKKYNQNKYEIDDDIKKRFYWKEYRPF